MSEIKIIKLMAPNIMSVNGRRSPCECDEKTTCAYCVQASLLGFDKKLKDNDTKAKNIVSHIKKNGIRKTAREFNVQSSTVQYWLKSENIPQWVLKKYAGCTNDHVTLHAT